MGSRTRLGRRQFLRGSVALAAGSLSAGCRTLPFRAAPRRAARIGFLALSLEENQPFLDAFADEMRSLGYVEGRDYAMEYRDAGGEPAPLPDLAADLVRENVDLFLVGVTPAALAAKQATGTIPIVFVNVGDPVRFGLVESLARPGGNVTGVSSNIAVIPQKLIELLKGAAPGISRVAILANAAGAGFSLLPGVEQAGEKLGLATQRLTIAGPGQHEAAFAALAEWPADALLMLPDALFYSERDRIVRLATRYRLPSAYPFPEFAHAGGLLAYGANVSANFRRAAHFVDKILQGTKPADIPAELPTTYDFVLNLNTARALGLSIPPSVLQQATELIQ